MSKEKCIKIHCWICSEEIKLKSEEFALIEMPEYLGFLHKKCAKQYNKENKEDIESEELPRAYLYRENKEARDEES